MFGRTVKTRPRLGFLQWHSALRSASSRIAVRPQISFESEAFGAHSASAVMVAGVEMPSIQRKTKPRRYDTGVQVMAGQETLVTNSY